ncbi:MAG: HD-GYP domain-containing protein [Firmicutes bacterium HGW-Firmicutes-15]|nr:MAG: HD-GYP domain-containing protein [Firmicutes bacterium HGW-Firmicutes-15]
MIRLPVSELFSGMVVGRAIIDAEQRVLLSSGQVLTEYFIKRIGDLGVAAVFINDQLGLEESPPPVSDSIILQATHTLKSSYQKCLKTGRLQIGAVKKQVDCMIDELITHGNAMVGMADIKNYDDYTYQHSVNVCVLALMLGISKGYNRAQLQKLGLGALLHDIGKVTIPIEILNKPSVLNSEERTIIMSHTWEGFNMIKSSGQVSLLSAHVALQHHEHIDGNGYPRKIRGDSIHEFAQITTVADIYDALVSDRPYRTGFSNHEALDIIEKGEGTQISASLVELLRVHVKICPVGTVVLLSTGDTALVTGENTADPKKPRVKLLFDQNQKANTLHHMVDLASYETVSICRMFSTEDAALVISRYLAIRNLKTSTA